MGVYTSEIASDKLASDNPVHKRLLKGYYAAIPYIEGDVLELGCGEGRGIEILSNLAKSYTATDKIKSVIDGLADKYENITFKTMVFPPFEGLKDETFDCVVTFHVIEHIEDDKQFLKEIFRVLKPGGKAIITTPNRKMSLTRNPWHVREYTANELSGLVSTIFKAGEMMGIAGNEKVMDYHERNRESVRKITRWDIFNLQYRLPGVLLRLPYDVLNRLNRNNLHKKNDDLVMDISLDDYSLKKQDEQNLDLFCIAVK
ncbi:MAG TPA: class I SAM-dependent methyltransferase [Cyclobacteriaceae bacterium]